MAEILIFGVVSGAIYALYALGITLVYKTSSAINFAQAEIGTFALYPATFVVTEHHLPWVLGALTALVVSVAISLAFEEVVIRRMISAPRVAVAVATVGLLSGLVGLEALWFGPSPRQLAPPLTTGSFSLAGVVILPSYWLSLIVVLVVTVVLTLFFRYTSFGLAVRAFADDPVAARLMGISQARVSRFTWATAGLLAGLAALLIEPSIGEIAPGVFGSLLLFGLTAAVIGGLSSLPGAVAGGLIVGIAQAFFTAHPLTTKLAGVQSIAMLVIILLVLLARQLWPRIAVGLRTSG